ncbi:hypothetical protein CsSME_00003709 [Camellia sinensis var. sinensis]|uniref:filament-like plant protein 7 isoform X1 n=1 Tax=Camellia sinensis TaxID=4442 RepID=UPI00103571FE|nr:filament-like plant protein 7 isoform X1 [Camellia sinensis]XP_028061711.1 filament-like plant protein 7 isoform X1 [Camellia sinensis]XP_028061712.1 filament-like plant protein 7 isoform X1 [Camellia sinensis]XP_028061713.1 filament-like plant protein 7 isoform X1 [Camellia sinensis]XP_028061714.1 filament-like plant protein 7 isoform X1 [Camellia sinensis]XP_028061715.1 filament-like plant protein 7 isoform X1 [Camellia sinensis]XP_028061716.1 filament-like plant protein 7 isoform X1 [Ca
MMDHKSWLWKKKSTEKTIVAADTVNLSQGGNAEEIQTLLKDKGELERDLKILNEKLSSALSECNAKDDLVEKHAKMAQEALAGLEKAEVEAMSLKQELDEVLQQRVAGEERLTHLDMALKECTQQLRFVREEQEQRIHDAVTKTSREFEKARNVLEDKLADANKRLTKLGAESAQLSKALLSKEKLIQEMEECRTKADADFNALMMRLESSEKDNASLKYEVRVLEKELEIRNEEREFNRRTSDLAHKQHLESAKKIAKLESECQRLRMLVRKRLPGPAALAKMKNEVGMLGRDPAEARWRKSNPSPTMDFAFDNAPDTPNRKINFLTEQLCAMDEENRNLKETLDKKANELQVSRIMYDRTASKLSQVEAQLEEPVRDIHIPHELSMASMSDMGSDDKVSCAESWASALISELEHFRNGKTVGASGIDLMDDFVEMEKLAIVSTDKPFGSSRLASVEEHEIVGPVEIESHGDSLAAAGREIVLLPESGLGIGVLNKDIQSKNMLIGKLPSWLQDVLKVVLEQNRVTRRKHEEILEDIKVALQYINPTNSSAFVDANESSNHFNASNHSDIGGYISQEAPAKSPLMESANRIKGDETQSESKVEGGTSQFSEADKVRTPKEQLSYLPIVSAWNEGKLEEIQPKVREECKKLKDEMANMESANKDLEERLQTQVDKSESLMFRLQESEKTIRSLQSELERLKESEDMNENQIENHKLVVEDLDAQLTVARAELNDARQKLSSLESELENKNNCCEELEASCLGLQLQLESFTKKEIPDQEEKQLRTDWEITAASEKLAECQETILNLGKQLKALASPREAALFDKLVSNPSDNITTTTTTPTKIIKQRSSLLEKMLAEDNVESGDLKFPKTMEVICLSSPQNSPGLLDPNGTPDHQQSFLHINGTKHNYNETVSGSLAIVPAKKNRGGGLLKKLFLRRKKGNSKKVTVRIAA